MAGRYQRLERGVGFRVPALIVGSWLGGCAIAAANHFLFQWLNGKEPYSEIKVARMQIWLSPDKESAVANALADVAKIFFGLSILTSLAQGMWRTARRRRLPLRQLDYIFGLPNPVKILRILFSRYVRMLFPLILVAASVYSLIIITVAAPGALVVGESSGYWRRIPIPTVNLSAAPGRMALVLSDPGATQPSLLYEYDMSIAISDNDYFWYAPHHCGYACNYTFSYFAPALNCTDLSADQISDQTENNPNSFPAQLRHWTLGNEDEDPEGDEVFVYNATSNLPIPGESKNVSDPYTFTLAFLPRSNQSVGATCTFMNATYQANVSFGLDPNQNQDINFDVTEWHNSLSDPWAQEENPCPWTYDGIGDSTAMNFSSCMTQGINARTMALGFTNYMRGTIQWVTNEVNTTAYLSPIFTLDNTHRNISLTDTDFTLGQSLYGLMGQLTLASVWRYDAITRGDALVNIGDAIYTYNPTRFWAAYGSAILITALCGAYGFMCLISNGGPGHLDLSHLMATSQSPGLAQLALTDDHNVVPDDMKRMVLAFGEVEVGEKGSERILAFGVVGQDDIKRRRPFSERHPSFGSTDLGG